MPRVSTAPGVVAPRHIVYVRLSELRPAFRNPKKHVLADIIASIQAFGFTNPVLRCDRVGRLAAGHGRTEGLVNMKAAGDPMPDGLVMDEDGEWCVPTIKGWSSRNDAELEAYIIADNKATENGGWDDQLLAEMLHDVHAFDPGLFETTGVTADDMDELMRTVDPERFDGEIRDGDGPDGGIGDDDDSDTAATPQPARVTCPACDHRFIPKET